MGAYLSEPVTDCESEAGGNHRLKYGATSMQGWRVNQEDSHNCIVDYDNGKSFFAVYDGHGGAEVAKYSSEHFPDFLKTLPQWKEGKLEECLTEAFIQFDDTLRSDEVIEQLKVIAGKKTDDEDGSEDGEDKRALIEEACMPLEQILKKYGLTVRHDDSDGPGSKKQKFLSPNLRGPGKKTKKHSNPTENSKNGVNNDIQTKLELDEGEVHPAEIGDSEDEKKNASKRLRQNIPDTPPSPISQQPPKRFKGLNSPDGVVVNGHSQPQNGNGNGNGDDELPTFRRHCFSESQSSTKTKADAAQARERTASGNSEDGRPKPGEPTLLTSPRQRNSKSESEAQDIAKSEEQQVAAANRSEMAEIASDVAAAGISRTTETPETQTAASSDDEHSADEDYKDDDARDHDDQDDTTSDGTDDSSEIEEDEVEGLEEDEDEGDDDEHMFPVPSGDTPGQDSGTTACVAVIVDDRLIVANAGDSRCILSRGGVAVELSLDHKPEDDIEKKRIEAAGGCISADGRVNGGLNLSRALGDHFYKRNEAIPLKDQMISALPDVRVETLTDADHFIVLACDGIWNSMTSQEVIDFVGARLAKDMPLQKICEEMCNNCLSPSTAGDGTGCDNMTVIIIKLTK